MIDSVKVPWSEFLKYSQGISSIERYSSTQIDDENLMFKGIAVSPSNTPTEWPKDYRSDRWKSIQETPDWKTLRRWAEDRLTSEEFAASLHREAEWMRNR